MRLADDERARVPFALVGVVVLLASTGFATVISVRDPGIQKTTADRAVDRVTAGARPVLAAAVERASRAAAREPVIRPANTTVGRAINDTAPFRDALRIRIYLAVSDALAAHSARVGATTATVRVPPVTDVASLRAAKRRVHVRQRSDGRSLAVRIDGLSVVLRRDGRVVDRSQYAPTITVTSPVLAVHDRVRAFEERLNRSPLEGPGLGRQLTARLYPMAWARGYARYGGAPITNVLANRHVALAANDGVLAVQKDVFGRRDQTGRRETRRVAVRVGARDLLEGAVERQNRWADSTRTSDGTDSTRGGTVPRMPSPGGGEREPLSRGVNATADRAFHRFVAGDGGTSLGGVLDDVYSADARLVVRTRLVDRHVVRAGRIPTDAIAVRRRTTTHVSNASAPPPPAPPTYHRLDSFARRVLVERTVVNRWERGNQTQYSTSTTRKRYLVRVAIVGRHARTPHAPARGIDGVHEPGGALDGPNLAGVRDAAVERLVDRRGGADGVARRAVLGSVDTDPVSVPADRPAGLREWVYADVAALRERVRSMTVAIPPDRALDANPAKRLADRIRARRTALVPVPDRYDGVAEKASVAARRAYLDAVVAALDADAARRRTVSDEIDAALERAGGDAALTHVRPGSWNRSPTGRAPVVSVEGTPAYLSLSAVEPERTAAIDRAYHPLAARNHNLFTAPYGDAADAVAGAVVERSTDRASLDDAARTLRAANRTLAERTDPSLADARGQLQPAVAESVSVVRRHLGRTVDDAASGLSPAAREAAVDAAISRWGTTHARALAATNGSLADAVVEEVQARSRDVTATDRDWLGVRVRMALRETRRTESVRVPEGTVESTGSRVRSLARDALAREVEAGLRSAGERTSRRLLDDVQTVPAGLPVAPVPGYWYATVNVWRVQVRGQYARFMVRAPGGTPAASPSGTVPYVREAGVVRLDVDGDGVRERLGRTTPVRFAVETAVVVAVPPGGPGVGDGVAIEQSAGWSDG